MKLRKSWAALAFAGMALAGGAHAQVTPASYTDGDLFLGFRATGGTGQTSDYLVNIGQVSTYVGATGPITVSGLGNMKADLDATYGSNWKSRADVLWSVSGKEQTSVTLYATKAQATAGVINATGWLRKSDTTQAQARNKMSSVADAYVLTGVSVNNSTANNPKGVIQPTTANNAYARYMPNGVGLGNPVTAYSYFSPTIEGNFANGTAASVLELYQMVPSTSGTPDGVLLGLFSMDDAGRLTFNPASRTGTPAVASGNSSYAFEAPTYRVLESATSLTVSVIRGGNVSQAGSVKVKTVAGTAKAPTDFTAFAAAGQTVSFAAGETQKNVTIALAGTVAAGFQADLNFTLTLESGLPSGSTVGSAATVAIQDTAAGKFDFTSASYTLAASFDGATPNTLPVSIKRTVGDNGDVAASVVEATGSTLHLGTDFTVSPAQTFFDRDSANRNYVVTLLSPTKTGTIKLGVGVVSPAIAGAAATVTVSADIKAPTVTLPAITVPTNGLVATFQGTANDTSAAAGVAGVAKVEYSLNGSAFANTTLGTPNGVATTFDVPALQMENGTNTLTIRATDKVGNVSLTSKNILFTDSFGPTGHDFAGTYSGLIKPTGVANNDKSGLFTVTVTATGALSGRVSIGGVISSFTGLLRSNGAGRFNPAPLSDYFYVIDRTEFDSFLGALTFQVQGSGATAHVVGQLSEDKTGAQAVGTFDAAKSPFGAANLVTTVFPGITLLNQTTKGVYNVALLHETQPAPLGNDTANWPQGDGAASLTILPSGAATLKGYLADGTVLTAAGSLTASGEVSLYVPLYKKNGSFAIKLSFAPTTDLDIASSDELWIRPTQPRARYYPNGWPNGITVNAIGAGWLNVVANRDFGQGADETTGNSTLIFGQGLFTPTPITNLVNVNSSTLAVALKPATGASYTLSLPASTGLMSGTFTDTYNGNSKPAYKGVLFVKPGSALNKGYGYFLTLPTTVAYGVTGQSGAVELSPLP